MNSCKNSLLSEVSRKQKSLKQASKNRMKRYGLALPIAIIGLFGVFTASAQNQDDGPKATVFQAAGPDNASILGTITQFRNVLGDNNGINPAPQPLTTGRREINWDGGGQATTQTGTPLDNFLGRGARFTTPGTGFVQAPPAGLATVFENPTYETIFKAFSPARLFSAIGSPVTDTLFFVPGNGTTAATSRGFGVIFSDIDLPDGGDDPSPRQGNRRSSTFIEYLGVNGDVLFSAFAPSSPGDGNLSFFGIVFDDPIIARVRITTGATPGFDDSRKRDVVMMDDFIYGEPQGIH